MYSAYFPSGVWRLPSEPGPIVAIPRAIEAPISGLVYYDYDVYRWTDMLMSRFQEAPLAGIIGHETLEDGEDTTGEFVSDPHRAGVLARKFPVLLNRILTDRPEMPIQRAVIKAWSMSSDKKTRLLAIKYLPRMDRSGSETAEARGGQHKRLT